MTHRAARGISLTLLDDESELFIQSLQSDSSRFISRLPMIDAVAARQLENKFIDNDSNTQ